MDSMQWDGSYNQKQPNTARYAEYVPRITNRYLTEHPNGEISVGCLTHSLDYWLDHMDGLARQFKSEYSEEEFDSFMVQILEIYKRRFRKLAK